LLLADEIDPLSRREAENIAKKIEAARSITFDDCASAYIKAHEANAPCEASSARAEHACECACGSRL
jgi:hypothetical protein